VNPWRVPTYRLVVEYDGSAFHGLQYQAALRTIAGSLEIALARLFHQIVKITAAGRTDAGVHATGQVISFSAERAFPIERLALALNANLPADLVIRDAALAADGFSARFDALERVYDYLILCRPFASALWRARAWHVPRAIDDARFAAAAEPLIGEHDFVSFCGELPERGGTVREITSIELTRRDELLRVTVRGNAFLHRMVRIIVGTLVGCATGYREVAFARSALDARERGAAGATAPAHGLYLVGVRYPGFDSYRPVDVAP
jgi:tRNA pseudouridine38-40 synthase